MGKTTTEFTKVVAPTAEVATMMSITATKQHRITTDTEASTQMARTEEAEGSQLEADPMRMVPRGFRMVIIAILGQICDRRLKRE